MSLLEYLEQSRTPKQKLIDAIRINDVRKVHELLESGLAPDLKIHVYGEDTVVHQAASRGHFRCIEELIKAGADCDTPNAFGVTPVFNAARRGHTLAMHVILKHSRDILGLHTLWHDGKWTEFLHTSATDPVLATLIIATPDVNQMRVNLCSNILCRCIQRNYVKSLYAFFLSGYKSDIDTYRAKIKAAIDNMSRAIGNSEILVSNSTEDRKMEYLTGFLKVDELLNKKVTHSLQHICRLRIRNAFHGNCNVYFGSEQINLPRSLKKYIVFHEEL